MQSIMVALVGGQPMPNLLPVRHLAPDGVLLIYTTGTQTVYQRLAALLRTTVNVYECPTDAYDIGMIETALRSRLTKPDLADSSLIFNLTGGTKAMVLAAYHIAQEWQAPIMYLESEGKKSRLYEYSWDNTQLMQKSSTVLPALVRLPDVLDLYLGQGNWQVTGPGTMPGGPFEQALAAALKQAQVDEVLVGVRTMNQQIDIDLVVRIENQVGIIEAKIGNAGQRLEGIKQLSNAVRHLGTYTQQFYAITTSLNPLHEDVVKAARITVISLAGYMNGQTNLPAAEAQRFAAIVRKCLVG